MADTHATVTVIGDSCPDGTIQTCCAQMFINVRLHSAITYMPCASISNPFVDQSKRMPAGQELRRSTALNWARASANVVREMRVSGEDGHIIAILEWVLVPAQAVPVSGICEPWVNVPFARMTDTPQTAPVPVSFHTFLTLHDDLPSRIEQSLEHPYTRRPAFLKT